MLFDIVMLSIRSGHIKYSTEAIFGRYDKNKNTASECQILLKI